MKKKEKILIPQLIAITVVVIIFAATRNKNNSDDTPVNSGTTLTDGQVENLEIPVEEKYVEVGDDGSKVNTSEALKSNKVVNNVEFSDIQLSQRDGETLLTATVKNNGSERNELFAVDVTLIDDAGQDIITISGLVAPMDAGATASFETSTTLDYANSYDFRVSAK